MSTNSAFGAFLETVESHGSPHVVVLVHWDRYGSTVMTQDFSSKERAQVVADWLNFKMAVNCTQVFPK